MALKVSTVDVWAGDIADRPGGLAEVLGAVAAAGASVECVIARRKDNSSGAGTVFVTPVNGKRAQDAARGAGLSLAGNIGTLRVEGADRPGLGRRITQSVADAGISMRGLTAAVLGGRFVAYVGFDSRADADRAASAIRRVSDAGGGRSNGGAGRKSGSARRAKTTKKKTTKNRARARR
jgi:hypothetical protein